MEGFKNTLTLIKLVKIYKTRNKIIIDINTMKS